MQLVQAFAASAATWQTFYILAGTAAATLMGLMFVAVTFGASLVTPETTPTARAFLDPPFYHFAHVLLTACLVVMPTIGPRVLGVALLVASGYRTAGLGRTFARMREAHRRFGDLELSDWLSGVVVPLVCYLALAASGAGFVVGYAVAFDALAVATLAILLLGIFGAWELMLWLAMERARKQPAD